MLGQFIRFGVCLGVSLGIAGLSLGHDGPDPLAHWIFNERNMQGGVVATRLGPKAKIVDSPMVHKDKYGESANLDGQDDRFLVTDDLSSLKEWLPKKFVTISAWVSLDNTTRYGGIVSAVQDNGGYEKGFVLGYDGKTFTWALSSKGSDDGDGFMNYLQAKTRIEFGATYHVVGTYDGETMKIYVNGKLENSSKAQSGDILYPEKGVFALGAYQDDNELHLMDGRIREIAIYGLAATEKWVAEEFDHQKNLTELKVVPEEPEEFELVVDQFYNYVQEDSVWVVWETTRTSDSVVRFGKSDEYGMTAEGKPGRIHKVKLTGLEPNTKYHVIAESKDDEGRVIKTIGGTFLTAVPKGIPFTFGVVADTQSNPTVNKEIGERMWAHRPNFWLLPGDLVGTGSNKNHWVKEFFGSVRPLLNRVPFFPVLGNHEGDARHYYDYMALPEPMYYYKFTYGDADYFIVDTNREVKPGSEQYKWLESELAKSTARWKFVSHHHPPYSTDENDYGNLWKGPGTGGDLRVRELAQLYDKYGVDIVWSGHIHSYERTWPLKGNRSVSKGGTIYMITGGGGGGLETPGPTRWFFTNTIRYGHHFTIVTINQNILEFKAFDQAGNLFDTMRIVKE